MFYKLDYLIIKPVFY